MLKGTHITCGVAAALVLSQPHTLNETALAITGGTIGAWIVDTDLKKFKKTKKFILDTAISTLFIVLLIVIDLFSQNGICSYISQNFQFRTILYLLLLIVLIIYSLSSKCTHRTFTHSILGTFLFAFAINGVCKPLTNTFLVGYISHLFLDLFNYDGIQLFFPFKKEFSFNKCYSDGKENTLLFWIFLFIDILLVANSLSKSVRLNYSDSSLLSFFNQSFIGQNVFNLYLLIINVISLLCFTALFRSDFFLNAYKYRDYQTGALFHFFSVMFYALALLGGWVGCFFSLAFSSKIKHSKYLLKFWAFIYSSAKIWFVLSKIIANPLILKNLEENISMFFMYLIMLFGFPYFWVYMLIINLIGLVLVLLNTNKRLDEYSSLHKWLFVFGILGGTIFPFIAVLVKGKFRTFEYITVGFPIMATSHAMFLWYLLIQL